MSFPDFYGVFITINSASGIIITAIFSSQKYVPNIMSTKKMLTGWFNKFSIK